MREGGFGAIFMVNDFVSDFKNMCPKANEARY
jgi:hypothetical protein